MKNKHVGFLVIGIAVLMFFIVMSFNHALQTIVDTTCTHGESCPMQITLKTQQTISYSLMGLLVVVGVFISFFMKDVEKIIHREIIKEKVNGGLSEEEKERRNEEKKRKLESLDDEERSVMNIVLREEGSIFQSDLIKETGMTKVKVSRLLDRLEGKGLIERKRRGMSNMVIGR